VLVREKASYHAPPYRQRRAAFGEYCRKVGFGVDGGGGWLWELLGPVTTPHWWVRSIGRMLIAFESYRLFGFYVLILVVIPRSSAAVGCAGGVP